MNNDIYKSISNGMLNKEKKIALSIVLAISLNVAVIIGVIFSSNLYVDSTNQKARESSGSYADVGFVNPTEEQIEIVEGFANIDYYGVTKEYFETLNEKWRFTDEADFKYNIVPTLSELEGDYPQNSGEVLIPVKMAKRLNLSVGDTLTNDQHELDNNQDFVVTGIYSSYMVSNSDYDFIYVSENQFDTADVTNFAYSIKFKKDNYENYEKLQEELGLSKDQIYKFVGIVQIKISQMYGVIIIGSIVALLSLFIILYNLLNIFNEKNIDTINKLNLIGINKNEVKIILNNQMQYYATRGIPLGCILGLIFVLAISLIGEYRLETYSSFALLTFVLLAFELLVIKLVFLRMHTDYKQRSSNKKSKQIISRKIRKLNINIFKKLSILKYFTKFKKQALIALSFSVSLLIVLSSSSLLNDQQVNNIEENVMVDIKVSIRNGELDLQSVLDFMVQDRNVSSVGYVTTNLESNSFYAESNKVFDQYMNKVFELDPTKREYESRYVEDGKYVFEILAIDQNLFEMIKEQQQLTMTYEEFENGHLLLSGSGNIIPELENLEFEPITIAGNENEMVFTPYEQILPEKYIADIGVGLVPRVYISESNHNYLYSDANQIIILFGKLRDTSKELVLAKEIKENFEDIEVFSKQERINDLKQLNYNTKVISIVIVTFLILLTLINFFTTIYIKLRSEMPEILLFRTLGLKEKEIKQVYLKDALYTIFNITILSVLLFTIIRVILNLSLTEDQLVMADSFTYTNLLVVLAITSVIIIAIFNYIYKITVTISKE